ncbi:MAG: protease inhibitor I42 family protein [Chloroflexi bacterium]|nr:protease inhibitor I42 family protein [Chloroflexota bacterium]
MTRIMGIMAVIMVALALGACMPGTGGQEITQADNGKTIEVNQGSEVKVVLVSNPTTGYSWQVAEVDAKVLQQVGEAQFKADSDAIGAGGKETFTFKAAGAGQTTLKMEYKRPWETDVAAAETFVVTIVVK